MKTILIAEDTIELRDLMVWQLEKVGYTVLVASNGMEALRIFKDHEEIIAVVTDLEMPMMNGVQLVASIREIDTKVPVVMWSGSINPGINGLNLFISKNDGPKPVLAFLKEVA